MSAALPDDILHVLCEHLADQKQFDTLFSCSTASRALAVPALTNLYRSHHEAPVIGGADHLGVPLATKLLMVQKWSIMWKSLIASSIGETLFPYCRYIRALDFRDLENLLDDDQFKGKISKQFFTGPLARFYKAETMKRANGRKYERLDIKGIIDAIGEVVTEHTPMLEMISGQLTSPALIRWAPRLPRLKGLELFDGSALEDALVPECIRQHCPHFGQLMIFTWSGEDRDHTFARFISAMKPNSLRTIHTINDVGAAAETFLALTSHGESLAELKLCVSDDSKPHLSLLAGCTSLETLRIEDTHGLIVLEETDEVFLETVEWLQKCEKLEHLGFSHVQGASALVTPVLLEHRVRLRSLEIDCYQLNNSRQFHQALVHQKDTLSFLRLAGDTEDVVRDDLDVLVDSLKQLTELKALELMLQEVFLEEHLITIINNLNSLEELYMNGLELTDRILDFVGKLCNLRSVTLAGISKFTVDGLLEFVSHLGPGNQSIRVMVDMADPDTMLPDEQVSLVRESLHEKVGGSLEYTPWRDPNISEFEGDSD